MERCGLAVVAVVAYIICGSTAPKMGAQEEIHREPRAIPSPAIATGRVPAERPRVAGRVAALIPLAQPVIRGNMRLAVRECIKVRAAAEVITAEEAVVISM
jgi:hypothetical protein